MSMLSSQIDTLRKAAQTYRDMGKYEAEQMLLDAADTIWQLRDDLQRANAENAELRHELAIREASAQEAVIEYLRQENINWEVMYGVLRAENAKLRKLAAELWDGYEDPPCEDCPFRDTPICADCPICAREAAVINLMRELRVEVD